MNEWCVCLNPRDASDGTYKTWVTIRFESETNLILFRTNNKETAGGQKWDVLGYVSDETELRFFTTSANETEAARIVATVVRRLGLVTNVGGFGAAWASATMERCRVNIATGRMLRAAPSIREGRPPRNKDRQADRRAAKRKALSVADMRARLLTR